MFRKILNFWLLIMTILLFLYNFNPIEVSANTINNIGTGPYLCTERIVTETYGSPEYRWRESGPTVSSPNVVYDTDLEGTPISATHLLNIITPLYKEIFEVCEDWEGTELYRRYLRTDVDEIHASVPARGTSTLSRVSGSPAQGRVNYSGEIVLVASDGLTTYDTIRVNVTATSYWVTGVSVGASGSTIEGEGTPSATYCTKTYGNGHSTSCSTSSSYTENNERRIYTFRYTDPHTGASGSAQSTMWFFDRVELSYSGANEILVDSVRGYSRADNDNTTCRLRYHNGATRNCSGNVSINERYGGWSIGDGTRTKRYSYTYTGPVSGNRDTGSATKTFYYVTDVEFRNSTNDVYVTTNARYNDANGESSLFFPTILFTIPY